MYFNWTYSTSVAIFIVEWKVNGSRIASDSGSFSPVTSYRGRVFQISNGQISLGPLTIADSGTYKAEVSYIDGTGHDSNQTNLIVYGKSFLLFLSQFHIQYKVLKKNFKILFLRSPESLR